MLDFGIPEANEAFAANDPNGFVAAMEAAGWMAAGRREAAGAPSIRVLRGKDVVVDRHSATSPYAILVITRAKLADNLGGDSIRDGENGCRVVVPPMRVVFEVELSDSEAAECGL